MKNTNLLKIYLSANLLINCKYYTYQKDLYFHFIETGQFKIIFQILADRHSNMMLLKLSDFKSISSIIEKRGGSGDYINSMNEYRRDDLSVKKQIDFFENGKIQNICSMGRKPDVAHGKWIKYYENGNIRFVSRFFKGKRGGKCVCYNIDGNIDEIINYKNGKIIDNGN